MGAVFEPRIVVVDDAHDILKCRDTRLVLLDFRKPLAFVRCAIICAIMWDLHAKYCSIRSYRKKERRYPRKQGIVLTFSFSYSMKHAPSLSVPNLKHRQMWAQWHDFKLLRFTQYWVKRVISKGSVIPMWRPIVCCKRHLCKEEYWNSCTCVGFCADYGEIARCARPACLATGAGVTSLPLLWARGSHTPDEVVLDLRPTPWDRI